MHVLIGCLWALAQLWLQSSALRAQGKADVLTAQVGEIAARNAVYQKRFRELLLTVSSRDLPTGWELARNLGQPVAPVLWQMLSEEQSNVDRRLVLLIAAVLAGGPGEDDRLFQLLDLRKPMLQERIMAGMLMALGPHRTRAIEEFWPRCMGPNSEPEPLLALAVRLAAARFPDALLRAPRLQGDDVGILAAAAFAGMRISPVKLKSLWQSEDRHAELFFRGALLGESWRLSIRGEVPTLLQQARDLLGLHDERYAAVRAAAILLRARAGDLDAAADRPDWRLLQLVASQPRSRHVVQAWLPSVPLARDEEPARLAVAYALYQPVAQVLKTMQEWSTQPDVRRDMAVALAFRLAGSGSTMRQPDQVGTNAVSNSPGKHDAIGMALPKVPEFAFVVWASGGKPDWSRACEDPKLAQLATLLADGRASAAVARNAWEGALWRWGSHPGIGPWQQERLLIRDLLLVGSKRGGGKYQSHIRPELLYVANGLDRSDTFFSIAVDLYEFLQAPVEPVPAEYRLP